MDITGHDTESLARKLDALDLTDGERAALDGLFAAASQAEVAGFTSFAIYNEQQGAPEPPPEKGGATPVLDLYDGASSRWGAYQNVLNAFYL